MEEIRLINNVEGSVVSNKMLNKVDDLTAAHRKIGQLEGELKVANQLMDSEIMDHEREVTEAQKEVRVIFSEDIKGSTTIIRDPWGNMMNILNNSPRSIKEITTTNIDNLGDLASAAAIGDAQKLKDEADEKLKKAEKTESRSKENLKLSEKLVTDIKKSQKDSIEKAVEFAEKKNIKEIKSLELDVKALHKEGDLMVDENSNLTKECDLTIEAMDGQLRMYKNRIAILERPNKSILDSIKSKLNSWYFTRRIKRLES